jgi:hypothetical protein
MMTEGIGETEGIGIITTGIATETMAVTMAVTVTVTGTMGGGEVVTALITITGDGETIATIATTDIIGTVGTIAGSNQQTRHLYKKATRFNRVAFLS